MRRTCRLVLSGVKRWSSVQYTIGKHFRAYEPSVRSSARRVWKVTCTRTELRFLSGLANTADLPACLPTTSASRMVSKGERKRATGGSGVPSFGMRCHKQTDLQTDYMKPRNARLTLAPCSLPRALPNAPMSPIICQALSFKSVYEINWVASGIDTLDNLE
jgi:hypothetical protein